jgi:hypothetical protein
MIHLRRASCSVALAVLALLATPAKASTNKVVNASFVTDLSSWMQVGSTSYDLYHSAVGHVTVGSAGVHFPGAGAYSGTFLKQCVAVAAGHSYSFSVWFQYPSTVQTTPIGSIHVHWNSSTNCAPPSEIGVVMGQSSSPTPDTWQNLGLSGQTAPAGAHTASVELQVSVGFAGVSSDALYDEATFYDSVGISGDANGDGIRAVADVFYLINNLFAGGPLPIGPMDVNSDDAVNVADIFYLINYLFAGGPPPS